LVAAEASRHRPAEEAAQVEVAAPVVAAERAAAIWHVTL